MNMLRRGVQWGRMSTIARRCMSSESGSGGGFSFPAPRSLDQVVKMDLLAQEPVDQVKSIWSKYHEEKDDAVATTLPASSYHSLVERAANSAFFIFPVYRSDGFFNMLCQFQESCFLLTTLEAFKENPTQAPPCLTISLYDELVESKGIALIRGDISNLLDEKESDKLLQQVLATYTREDLYEFVDQFNNRPEEFDFETYRKAIQ